MAGVSVRVYVVIIPRYLKISNLFNLIPSVCERRGLQLLMLKDHGCGLLDVDFHPSVRTKGMQYVQLALQPLCGIREECNIISKQKYCNQKFYKAWQSVSPGASSGRVSSSSR